jgi:ribose transport system substrate-binding protein
MKKLTFLVSLPTRDNDFQVEQAHSAEQAAVKLGIDLNVTYSDNDTVNQSTQILKAIQSPIESRPQGIVFEPVHSSALPQVARAASNAGVGWAVLNRTPTYLSEMRGTTKAPAFALSSSHVEIGRIQGRQFGALLPAGGSVLYIEGPSYSVSAKERTAGMLETKHANILVTTLKGQWTEESAEGAVLSWLKLVTSQKAPFDLVGAQDDSMAIGARKAFEKIANKAERDRWLSLPFTGCDGVPKTGQAWVRNGLLTATIYIPPLAGPAVEILARAINTGTQPPEHSLTASVSIPPLNKLVPRKS